MSKKFIPNGDLDFVTKAESMARTVASDPERFEISAEDSSQLTTAVKQFRAAFQAARSGGRSEIKTRLKDDARAAVEVIMRRLAHLVRSNLRLDAATRMCLGIHPRKEKPKVLPCPQEPPRLRFVRAIHEGSGTPMHELSFTAWDFGKAKPPGAVRLELYVSLIPPGEPIPTHPTVGPAGCSWYLRSYTRSPIVLVPPMPRVPMRVVYWGRWADSMGGFGPFSPTAVAWIEDGSQRGLPGGVEMTLGSLGSRKPVPILEDAGAPHGDRREAKYTIAILEAQYHLLNPPQAAALPAPQNEQIERAEANRAA